MAEGFEIYHVPQQSRRDKLRVGISTNNFLPLYHPNSNSLIFDNNFTQNPSFYHLNNYPPSSAAAVQPLSLELNLQQRYPSSALPLLRASKFLNPVQQLLRDLFHCADNVFPPDSAAFLDPLLETLAGDISSSAAADHDPITTADGGADCRSHKSRLVSMLDEVYRRYKLYYQQMQAVVTTFEYAAGLGNAAPYVNLAVKAMYKHFTFLKNAISEQLQLNKQHPYNPYCSRSIPNYNAALLDHQPIWRPQRGLPESAVTILRAWLFEHFLHPYPTDTDKLMLANQTGLSRNQVSNWFINARVRLWKPMVEEIHMLETKQAQKSHQRETNNNEKAFNNNNNNHNNHLSSTNKSISKDENNINNNNASSSNHDHRPPDLSNSNFFPTNHPYAAAGPVTMGGGNVSLTLGLQQNHGGITLTEAFPINAASHFNLGLEANGEGFVNEWF